MRLAIMQPYFLPYIGYFQLMQAVDTFVLYDNIKYTKKGWINRNRFLRNGKDAVFSVPLRSASDSLDIRDRQVAADFDREKLLNQFLGAYRNAPFFTQTFKLIEQVVHHENTNLFGYLCHSIRLTCEYLGIVVDFRTSSNVNIDHALKGQDKVLAMCTALDASTYVNPPGGIGLYSSKAFRERNIELRFIRPQVCEYSQFDHEFVPWLSIVDVMMFNSVDAIRTRILPRFELVQG
ncbi:MAG: WbqC family protein [Burkholderiales bacterium]|nr:WbqC family protein [Burkholderiales bacterium]